MSDQETQTVAKRERSPAYPTINLRVAIERLVALDEYFKRHPAPISKVGLAWDMKPTSSQAYSAIAALKSYGLVEYEGSGADLKAKVTDDARTYLRAQQEGTKREVLRRAAMRPKALTKYWNLWGADRPPDPICLDELVLKAKFSQAGAENFLKVYDANIAYAGLSGSDKISIKEEDRTDENDTQGVGIGDLIQWESAGVLQFDQPKRVRAIQPHEGSDWVFVDGSDTGIPMNEVTIEQKGAKPQIAPPILAEEVRALASEREWLRGKLSQDASYRLIVTGDLGPKEIGRLIKLLEAQKDVLSDDEKDAAS
jgi:hypothetical protein